MSEKLADLTDEQIVNRLVLACIELEHDYKSEHELSELRQCAGKLLLVAKERHDDFDEWLRQNFRHTPEQARSYLAAAGHSNGRLTDWAREELSRRSFSEASKQRLIRLAKTGRRDLFDQAVSGDMSIRSAIREAGIKESPNIVKEDDRTVQGLPEWASECEGKFGEARRRLGFGSNKFRELVAVARAGRRDLYDAIISGEITSHAAYHECNVPREQHIPSLPDWAADLNRNAVECKEDLGISFDSIKKLRAIAKSGNRRLYHAVRTGRIPVATALRAIKKHSEHDKQLQSAINMAGASRVAPAVCRHDSKFDSLVSLLDSAENTLYGCLQQYGPEADHRWLSRLSCEQKEDLQAHANRLMSLAAKVANHLRSIERS